MLSVLCTLAFIWWYSLCHCPSTIADSMAARSQNCIICFLNSMPNLTRISNMISLHHHAWYAYLVLFDTPLCRQKQAATKSHASCARTSCPISARRMQEACVRNRLHFPSGCFWCSPCARRCLLLLFLVCFLALFRLLDYS